MDTETNLSWPAAKQGGTLLVAHPAWEEARNAILDLAAEGPVTVVLIGPSATGKTWLLQELAGCLGDHGFPTMVLLQGDLPAFLSDGAALLIDQALVMPEATLDLLMTQHRGVVILADVERFHRLVQARSPDPVVIALRALDDAEMSAFIDEWLRQSGHLPDRLDPVAHASLIAQAHGLVGHAVPLLEAALAAPPLLAPEPTAPKPAAPELATPKPAMPELPMPVSQPRPGLTNRPAPRHHATRRVIMAGTALAACFALAWAVGTRLSSLDATTIATTIPVPVPIQTATASASLPPLRAAEISAPTLALQTPAPAPTNLAATEPLPTSTTPVAPAPSPIEHADSTPLPEAAPAEIRVAPASPVAPPAAPVTTLAAIPQPPEVVAIPHPERVPAGPTTTASLVAPPFALPSARPSTKPGGVGMVLLVQRGDTLESMYHDIYRDRSAPPYAEVVAANPRPLKPGGIVVFPAPPGGWSATQP